MNSLTFCLHNKADLMKDMFFNYTRSGSRDVLACLIEFFLFRLSVFASCASLSSLFLISSVGEVSHKTSLEGKKERF